MKSVRALRFPIFISATVVIRFHCLFHPKRDIGVSRLSKQRCCSLWSRDSDKIWVVMFPITTSLWEMWLLNWMYQSWSGKS